LSISPPHSAGGEERGEVSELPAAGLNHDSHACGRLKGILLLGKPEDLGSGV